MADADGAAGAVFHRTCQWCDVMWGEYNFPFVQFSVAFFSVALFTFYQIIHK